MKLPDLATQIGVEASLGETNGCLSLSNQQRYVTEVVFLSERSELF